MKHAMLVSLIKTIKIQTKPDLCSSSSLGTMEGNVWFDAKKLICQRQKKKMWSRIGTRLALDLRFHRAMLFRSGEVNPAEDTLGLLNSTVELLQLGQNKTRLMRFTCMKGCKCLKMLSSTCCWNTKLVLTKFCTQSFIPQPANQCTYGVCRRARTMPLKRSLPCRLHISVPRPLIYI
jgi:hypothetical protein